MTRLAQRFAPVLLLGGLLAGCNNGGIMELELSLPPAPDAFDVGPCTGAGECTEGACEAGRCIYRGTWYSQVEITSRFEFVGASGPLQWSVGQAGALEPVPLAQGGSDARWSCTSVLGDPSVETLRVRLRYCRSLPCTETLNPDIEHWFEIERPFYGNRRTHVRRVAPPIPAASNRCSTDADCTAASEGPRCLSGSLACGCTEDAQCPSGHCEGAQTPLGEGRCTVDVGRCNVMGCIAGDPLEASDVCVSGQHPCSRDSATNVDYVRPSGGGCFRQDVM